MFTRTDLTEKRLHDNTLTTAWAAHSGHFILFEF